MPVRSLRKNDLDPVIEIDAALMGRTRRSYFERRLAHALAMPERHMQFAVEREEKLVGFVLGREQDGEFGKAERVVRFESLGVATQVQGRGVGQELLGALVEAAKRHGAKELRTTSTWTNHAMLRFLDRTGFQLAPSNVIECAVRYPDRTRSDEEEPAAAVQITSLSEDQIPALIAIDKKLTGRDRTAYIRQKVEESLRESSVRASLAAIVDGMVVGFLTARVDLGDAGRTEPTAILDTIGVHPAFGSRGIGKDLMDQLLMNLLALRVEKMETTVAHDDIRLLRFFHRAGFVPSQRLAFAKTSL